MDSASRRCETNERELQRPSSAPAPECCGCRLFTRWISSLTSTRRSRGVKSPGDVNSRRARSERTAGRSEEHTSELQSRFDLVCRLLLEKKNESETWCDTNTH